MSVTSMRSPHVDTAHGRLPHWAEILRPWCQPLPTICSPQLDAALRQHVLRSNAAADPKGTVAGGCGLTALLHTSMAALQWNTTKPMPMNYWKYYTTWKDLTHVMLNWRIQAQQIPTEWFQVYRAQNCLKQSTVVDVRIVIAFDQGSNDWKAAFGRLLHLPHHYLGGGSTCVHFVKSHWVVHRDLYLFPYCVTLQWKINDFL